jgi:vacuolar protein sorting-associated protein IST1
MAITRMNLLKNKKTNSIKLQKREIAQLLAQEKDESARIKVENIIREDYTIEAFEILELFCELLSARIQLIQESKTCPHDLKEAVSTLIYAAPRLEVPEFQVIRKQLELKFGKEFVKAAMENKDLAVNQRVMFKLGVKVPEPYLCVQYLKEIAREHDVKWDEENSIGSVDMPGIYNPTHNVEQPLVQQPIVQPPVTKDPFSPLQQPIIPQETLPQNQFGHVNPPPPIVGDDDIFGAKTVEPDHTFNKPSMQMPPENNEDIFAQQTNKNEPNDDAPSYDFDELQKRFEALKKRE